MSEFQSAMQIHFKECMRKQFKQECLRTDKYKNTNKHACACISRENINAFVVLKTES